MSLSKILALALLILAALSSGCVSTTVRGHNSNIRMEGMFRFNIMQNDVISDDGTQLASLPLPSVGEGRGEGGL